MIERDFKNKCLSMLSVLDFTELSKRYWGIFQNFFQTVSVNFALKCVLNRILILVIMQVREHKTSAML